MISKGQITLCYIPTLNPLPFAEQSNSTINLLYDEKSNDAIGPWSHSDWTLGLLKLRHG